MIVTDVSRGPIDKTREAIPSALFSVKWARWNLRSSFHNTVSFLFFSTIFHLYPFLLPLSKQKDETSKHKQSSSGISKWIHSRWSVVTHTHKRMGYKPLKTEVLLREKNKNKKRKTKKDEKNGGRWRASQIIIFLSFENEPIGLLCVCIMCPPIQTMPSSRTKRKKDTAFQGCRRHFNIIFFSSSFQTSERCSAHSRKEKKQKLWKFIIILTIQ